MRLTTVTRVLLAALVLGMVPGALGAPARAGGDPSRHRQWGLERINGPEGWEKGRGRGVTIAVVDSGVDPTHEDLVERIEARVDCIGADGDPSRCRPGGVDDFGHGTHVAGIAAATAGNGKGVAGVAPEARILAVRVLEATTDEATGKRTAQGDIGDIRAGIRWAVDHGADIVNLSLGESVVLRNVFGSSLETAIEHAWEAGVIPVISAGNRSGTLFTAGYGGLPAVVVTATDVGDDQAHYATNVGAAEWGVAAPGGESDRLEHMILSTSWKSGKRNFYSYKTGTSMAAPHVSGALAVLLSAGVSRDDAVHRLTSTARDLGTPGRDRDFGWGLVDVEAASRGLPDLPEEPEKPSRRQVRASGSERQIVVAAPVAPPSTAALPPEGLYRFEAPPAGSGEEKVAEAPRRRRPQQPRGGGEVVDVPAPDPGGGSGTAPYLWGAAGVLVLFGLMARRAAVR